MRITNSAIQRQALAGFQQALREMDELQTQIGGGQRVRKASHDPVAAGTIIRTDNSLRALEQYQRNIAQARTRVDIEDSVLDQVTDRMTRAKALAVGQADSTANSTSRLAAANEVAEIINTVVQLGNTRHSGVYIFGGDHADRAPLGADGEVDTDAPPVGRHRVEVASDQLFAVNNDAQTIFVNSGVIDALHELHDGLTADDGRAIASSISSIDAAFDHVQALIGDVGARANTLDVASANTESLDVTLRTFRSDLADTELEEALSRLINRQTSFQAALLANAQILQTTLTDYLR